MDKLINIKDDCIMFFGKSVEIPTKLNTLKEVLGQGNIEKLPNGNPIYVWEQNGFYAWLDGEEVTGIRININIKEFKLCNKNFEGKILINNQNIETLKWKKDEYNIGKEYKIGKFNLFLEKVVLNFMTD